MADTTILVVDDEPQIRRVLQATLSSSGYDVILAKDGQEAIEMVIREHPDLILLDVNMPGMSGLDLHRHLSTAGNRIPTILITAYPDNTVRERALNAGVICYLSKPFDEGDLLSCIHSALPSDNP